MGQPKILLPSGGKMTPTKLDSQFKMIDVGEKVPTRRRAIARGMIRVGQDAFERIRMGTLPKGNVLGLAEIAGIMAAKRASEFIPLCHPLGLEQVQVKCELHAETASIEVSCEAIAFAKTGVEMEALAGVNGALLSIYDLTKGVNPALWISDIHLELKEGGKSGRWTHPDLSQSKVSHEEHRHGHTSEGPLFQDLKFAVLTISDRVSRGLAQDGSGPAIEEFCRTRGGVIVAHAVVPDERGEIAGWIQNMVGKVDAVICTGGTGLGPRDVTPEALRTLEGRVIPGMGELLRKAGAEKTQNAWLSRSEAIALGNSLVIPLPGSTKAVLEGLSALEKVIPHALQMMRGGGH